MPDGLGNQIGAFHEGDGAGIQTLYEGDGTVLWNAIPDSVVKQFVASSATSGGNWTSEDGNVTLSAVGSPTVQSAALNGEDTVYYDGVDDGHENVSFSLAQPLAIIAVWKVPNGGSNSTRSVHSQQNDSDLRPLPNYNGNISIFAGGNLISGAAANTNWNIHSAIFDGPNSETRTGGSTDATGDAGGDDMEDITVAYDSGAGYSEIEMAEFWILDNPTSQDVADSEQYLNDKYAVF